MFCCYVLSLLNSLPMISFKVDKDSSSFGVIREEMGQ